MENAKYIGCMWTLSVALGVGLAVANTPAVASAAPGNSGKGSPSGESSQSSHPPSAKKSASSATNDAPGHRRGDGTAATATTGSSTESGGTAPGESGHDAAQRGGLISRSRSNAVPAKVNQIRVRVNADAAEPTVPGHGLDLSTTKSAATPIATLKAPPTSSSAAAPAMAPHPAASTVSTPTAVDPASHMVSTLINAVLSPFAGSAPTAPVQNPAAFTLLAFARREFEPSMIVNQPAADVSTSAVDPDFITSTHTLGPITITSAADPDDNHYVAIVLSTPLFTNVLTSGTDPEDNLGFGAASIGRAGHTVNTLITPNRNFSVAIPITDPLAPLFTLLVRLGF